VFLSAAQLLGTTLLTADEKLRDNIGSRTPLLVWIEDYEII